MENKRKHLEFIQAIIGRMASNLFFLRGWTITLIAGLFALSAKDANPKYVYIAFVPLFLFWVLDGYFLSQERLFRALYDHVRRLAENDIDFSMNVSVYRKDRRNGWLCSMFSRTLLLFYLPLLAVTCSIAYLVLR